MSGKEAIRDKLQKLDGYDFEHLIADIWADQGWKTRVLPASNDRGIDVEARRSDPIEQKYLIQAKRYSEGKNVRSSQVQQYSSLKHQEENVDVVIIVTTSDFTPQAKERATNLNLKLINGDDLAQLIQTQDALHLVNKYLSGEASSTNTTSNTDRPANRIIASADVLPHKKQAVREVLLNSTVHSGDNIRIELDDQDILVKIERTQPRSNEHRPVYINQATRISL